MNKSTEPEKETKKGLPGNPIYSSSEDIYAREEKIAYINPDGATEMSGAPLKPDEANEKDFGETLTGDDLDVPGSELDDAQESIGEEDEENNYYSLGGDDHNDLEENNNAQ